MSISTHVVTRQADFRRLRAEWNELLEQSSIKSPFLTWEWMYTWWRHLADDRQLFIVLVRNGSQLVAIAPLALRPMRLRRLLPFRALEFLGSGNAGSDYLGILLRPGFELAALEAIGVSLGKHRLAMELTRVDKQSAVMRQLVSFLQKQGWHSLQTQTDRCPFIDFAGRNWDDYLAGLGKNHRYNFGRRFRQLGKNFSFSFEAAANAEQCGLFLDVLVSLHLQRWNGRGGSDALHTSSLVEFHQDFSRLALQQGWLRLYVMKLNETPVAALYGFQYANTFYFYQSGFDPDYGRYSVGLVTMGLAIRRAMEEGSEQFDLLHGEESYKFLWANGSRDLVRLDCFPPRPAGVLFSQGMQVRRAVKRIAGQLYTNNSQSKTRTVG